MLKNNINDLVSNVMGTLANIRIDGFEVDEEKGTAEKVEGLNPFYINTPDTQVTQFSNTQKPAYSENYSTDKLVGLNSMVESIVKETVSYIIENMELVPKSRYDQLESDFDAFVVAMSTVGVGPATAVPAAVAAFNISNSPAVRVALKAKEKIEDTDVK
jgi:hypothetical protein